MRYDLSRSGPLFRMTDENRRSSGDTNRLVLSVGLVQKPAGKMEKAKTRRARQTEENATPSGETARRVQRASGRCSGGRGQGRSSDAFSPSARGQRGARGRSRFVGLGSRLNGGEWTDSVFIRLPRFVLLL